MPTTEAEQDTMDRLGSVVMTEVERVVFGDPDRFTETYWIFVYAMVLLVFSAVYNVNAIIPRTSALYTPEYYERLVEVFHVVLILLGIGLLTWQLLIPIRVKRKHGKLVLHKPKIFPKHMVSVAWILTTVSVLFLVWKIIFEAIFLSFHPCDEAILVPSLASPDGPEHRETAQHRQLIIASDFIYYVVFSVFLVLQCSYVHVWSKYRIPADFHPISFPLNTIHIVIVNLAIYVRMTLVEAKETYEHQEKYKPWIGTNDDPFDEDSYSTGHAEERIRRAATTTSTIVEHTTVAQHGGGGGGGHGHADEWTCNTTSWPTGLKGYWKTANSAIIEPFGFAMTIECILTLALFVNGIMHHIHDEGGATHEGEDEGDGDTAPKGNLTRGVTFMGQIVRVKDRYKKEKEGNFVHVTRMPWRFRIGGMINGVIFLVIAALATCFTVFFFLYFMHYYDWAKHSQPDTPLYNEARASEKLGQFKRHAEAFLGTEMAASLLLLFILLVAIFHQARKRPIPGHALQDIKLLMFSMAGEIALAFFIFLACVFNKKPVQNKKTGESIDDYPWDYLTKSFAAKSVIDIVVAIIQTMYISRALGYKTYVDRYKWLVEAGTLFSVIVFNVYMWLIEVYGRKFTFRANFVASNFYDRPTWSIVNEVVYPIAIFYRFHSLVLSISMLGMLWHYMRKIKNRPNLGPSGVALPEISRQATAKIHPDDDINIGRNSRPMNLED